MSFSSFVRPSLVLAALSLITLATGCATTGVGATGPQPGVAPPSLGRPGPESYAKEERVKVRVAEHVRRDVDGVRATSRSAESVTCARCKN